MIRNLWAFIFGFKLFAPARGSRFNSVINVPDPVVTSGSIDQYVEDVTQV